MSAAQRIAHLTVRNRRTRKFLKDCGVNKQIKLVADPAVLMAKPRKPSHHLRGRLRIGVLCAALEFPTKFIDLMKRSAIANAEHVNPNVVRLLNHEQKKNLDHEECFRRLAASLRAIDHAIPLEVCGLHNMYEDHLMAAKLAKELGTSIGPQLSHPVGRDLLKWIRTLDCLIGFRLHHCILSLVAGTPLVGIDLYYDAGAGTSKLKEFITSSPEIGSYVTIEDLLSGDVSHLNQLVERALSVRGCVADIHADMHNKSHSHFDWLAEVIACE